MIPLFLQVAVLGGAASFLPTCAAVATDFYFLRNATQHFIKLRSN